MRASLIYDQRKRCWSLKTPGKGPGVQLMRKLLYWGFPIVQMTGVQNVGVWGSFSYLALPRCCRLSLVSLLKIQSHPCPCKALAWGPWGSLPSRSCLFAVLFHRCWVRTMGCCFLQSHLHPGKEEAGRAGKGGFGWPLHCCREGRIPLGNQDLQGEPLCPSLGWVMCGWRLGGCWVASSPVSVPWW